jgi:hypothetical protein
MHKYDYNYGNNDDLIHGRFALIKVSFSERKEDYLKEFESRWRFLGECLKFLL